MVDTGGFLLSFELDMLRKKLGRIRAGRSSTLSPKAEQKLKAHSNKVRSKELSDDKKAASAANNPTTTLKLNVKGDLRGMHMAKNPPDSDHMRKVRAMRNFYNKQMPVLQCSHCSFSTQCPKFKAGFECAFLPFLNSHKVESTEDLKQYGKMLVESNMRRVHMSLMMESMTGGAPTLETTESLNLAFQQVMQLDERLDSQSELTLETDDQSIIGKLFGTIDELVDDTTGCHISESTDALSALENAKAQVSADNSTLPEMLRKAQEEQVIKKAGNKKAPVVEVVTIN